ncbi:MAG TPA: carbohydrate ABC transporter permease [bacterium]|nr:carbohydrate ABC transporter permease [bacterium]
MTRLARYVHEGGRHTLLWLLIGLTFFPFILMVITSFKDNTQFYRSFFAVTLPLHYSNYGLAWADINHYILNSLIVTAFSTAGVVVVSSLAAYAFARFAFPGKEVLYYLVIALMMVPGVLTLVPSFVLVKELGLLNTRQALILPYIAGGEVFGIFVLRAFFATLPEELFEAARIDGASEAVTFWRIALPLTKPALGAIAILQVLYSWNDYVWPLITVFDSSLKTLTLGLLDFQNKYVTNWGPLMAAYTIASIPLLILFALATRTFITGLMSGGLKL